MPRRRAKQPASQGGSMLKRQKRVGGTENMSEGAASGLSTPAAPEDSGRGSEAASMPNIVSKPEDTSATDSGDASTTDSCISKDCGVTSPTDSGITEDVGVSKVDGVTSTTDNGVSKDGSVTSTTDNGVSKDGGVTEDGGVSKVGGVTSTTDGGDTPTTDKGVSKHGSVPSMSAAESAEKYWAGRDLQLKSVRESLAHPINYKNEQYFDDIWKPLVLEIHVMAFNAFPRDARPWETLGADIQEKLNRWSPNAKEMLESTPDARGPLYIAWIWHILDDNLFSIKGTGKLSRNEYWDCYHKLQHVFHESWGNPAPENEPWDAVKLVGKAYENRFNTSYLCREDLIIKYHFWKQITFELMQYERVDTDMSCATTGQIIDLIESELGPINKPKPGDPFRKLVDADTLEGIAVLALALYCKINGSATQWLITFGHPQTGQLSGFSVDSEVMKIFGPETRLPVDLVIQPLLQARGNEDGLDYDYVRKKADMLVLVDWPAYKRSSARD